MEVAPYFLLLLELLGVVGRCVLSVLVYMLRLVVPASRKSLRDKRVLVTGAGHGLGREIALRCAQLGAKLVLLDINKVGVFRRCVLVHSYKYAHPIFDNLSSFWVGDFFFLSCFPGYEFIFGYAHTSGLFSR